MENKTFTFHIHLPEGIENIGQPIVLGDIKELGFWENPIAKLFQPFPKNPTYWQSEPIIISISNIPEKNCIQYRFAIHIPKPSFHEKNVFEGNSDEDSRILDIEKENQFAIWKNNFNLSQKLSLDQIQDYAFVDYIFNSIEVHNFKDKVMEYQHLLDLHNDVTICASNLEYIVNNIDDKLKEKRLFLCLLLGHHILRQDLNYELPTSFSSELLLDALDNYKQEIFPSDVKVLFQTAITTLIQHNAFQYQFHWLKIFTLMATIDLKYNFIYHLNTLKYPNDDLLEKFIKEVEIISPHIKDIDFDIYVKIAKWLIQLCYNNVSLFKLWNDILAHNNEIDKNIFKFFIDQVQKNISNGDSVALENDFNIIPKDCHDDVAEVFRNHILFLLENPIRKWENRDIFAIQKLLQNDGLNWSDDDAIISLEYISQSRSLELLNIFPEILDNFFRNNFSDTKKKRLLSICTNWFTLLLFKLSTYEKSISNEINFISLIFQQLERMHPLLSHRKNIWQNLTTIVAKKVKSRPESQIIDTIKLIGQIKEQEIKELFSDIIKEVVFNKTIQQINDRLIGKIFTICGCKGSKILNIPNTMIEDILCYILDELQRKSNVSDASEQYINIIKSSKFLILILNSTGSVQRLNANTYLQHIQMSIVELNGLLIDKTINLQLLQQLLKYSDEQLFQYFDEIIGKKSLGHLTISRDEIAKLRKLYHDYELKLDQLLTFYNNHCSASKVTDVNNFIQDIKKRMQNLDKVILNKSILSDHWKLHEKTLDSAKRCYKFGQSQIFNNIFEVYLREDAAINVEYISQVLTPAVFKKCDALCKEWEKVKCSDAFLKNVTKVDVEIELISSSSKNQKFSQALKNLSKIPQWIERFEHLKKVVKIFKVPHNEDDWLSKSIRILKDDSVTLRVLNNFFDYLDKNHSVSQDCWGLIKELSIAKDLMVFLQIIGKFDTRKLLTYVNNVDKHLNIQEDTISSLVQVEQLLFPLMNKDKVENIDELLKELQDVIIKNSSLGGKVALCNNYSMTLRMMYNTILNRGEVTKENIKNIVLNGIYIFVRDERKDKCLVSLEYSSNVIYNLNEILDLRVRALSIAKKDTDSKSIDDILNDYDTVMDDFIFQVDVAQEIIVVVSVLIQLGHFHFGNKNFEKKLQGTNNMEDYLKFLNNELEKWKEIVDRARERCYYLTFFSVRHILTLYDYFTSKKLDKKNEEECKTLIRFVNSKAQLPSRNEVVLCEPKDDPETLHEIGEKLKRIFENSPKQMRKFNVTGQRVMSDVVTKGKLSVATCTDSLRIPNVIMSLYANHGYYPEPWQLLICTSLTTMEELMIFIKRSFFASNNGYKNHLFCIANPELLDFELQYNLVNQIRTMQKLHDQEIDYLLALICYKKTGMHHYILDQFSQDVHETNGLNTEMMREVYRKLCQNVIRVSSDLSGQGKTEWIKEASSTKKKILRSFLISDGMGFDKLVSQFKECKLQPTESMHINIVSTDHPEDVNMFLFKLLTLGMVSANVDIAYLPSLETPTYVFIEIASTVEQRLLNSLPMARYTLFNHLTWNIKNLSVSQEINSPIQIVCYYLSLLDCNKIDIKEVHFRTNEATKKPLPAERCQFLIDKYIFNNNVKVVFSFRFFEIFINVLTDQLVRLSSNQHFTLNNLGNLKLIVEEANITLILRMLIVISKDLAARSIKIRATELESIAADGRNFVQWDDLNNFVLFFNSQAQDTITLLYSDRTKAYDNAKLLLKSDHPNWKLDDYGTMSENEILMKLERMARGSTQKLSLPEYVLTSDNLIKMALILLRVRANVPVVICGEAGCGKTSLIAYLAIMVEVQFQTLNLHAGIDEKTFVMFINDAMKKAEKGEIWLLFNGINTCNHIDLLADLISHRILNGKYIHPNIRLFSTCNPYRPRTRTQSKAVDLKTKVKKYEEKSNLVYQVKPLPDQIFDYVFDYGILNSKGELKYIQIMVEKELKKLAHPVFVELLSASQRFIRKVEEPYSVSLRDVKRAITLVKFFYNSLEKRQAYRRGQVHPSSENPTITIKSYILALCICYYFRLYEQDLRKQYHHDMGQIFQTRNFDLEEDVFAGIIREEQEYYINRMKIPSNVAITEALSENILVMIVCILTRIPLFLIGAPGTSKSLAIDLISSNLNGFNSRDEYFRTLPQVYLITHQGSLSSTSDDIIKVFDKAKKYQETNSKEFPIISVVLLNEVGLDEMSPFNPLSVLHSLLEPSYPDTELTVAVIGISNWRPDNSKISRAILVQRPLLNLDDLVSTTVRLLNIELGDQRDTLKFLSKAYLDYEKCDQISPNFHGLHDYYALIKQLSLDEMIPENIQIALARNFGGIENNAKLYEKHFENVLKILNNHEPWVYKPIPIEKLINLDLEDPDARHLMVIGKSDTIVNLLTCQFKEKNLDPVVILGSQFPSDREDYLYNILCRILMCIEEGRPLILADLETIYERLYDLWNQNYIVIGSRENVKYFIRVTLGAYTNLIYVSPNFKCILVMDEKSLASFESSFLSRFEKQKMSISDILNDRQKSLVENLKDWTKRMSTYVGANPVTELLNKFTQKDLFIGFDKDETLQSLVIDTTKNNPEAENNEILENCKECLIAIASSDGIIRTEQSVLERDEVDRWKHVYYYKQNHECLYDYFSTLFNQERLLTDSERHLVIVNTFSSINTDVKCSLQGLVKCQVDTLSAFKTEVQFSNWVKHFWLKSTDNMLILQCDVTTVNARCIKLAKFIIEQFRNEYMAKEDHMEQEKHACIILHIHRNQSLTLSFNFMCGWKQITIETLSRNARNDTNLLNKSLYDIITCTYPFEEILQEELLWCLSCMKYPSNDISANHVKILSEKILKCSKFIKCLKERTLEWIEEKSKSDRAYKVVLNDRSYTSFSLACQVHIRTLVRKPIAQILCALERMSATKTIFYIENNDVLFKFWRQIFMDKKIVKIEDLSDPKPDEYIMAPENYDLKFPFSLYFMKQINRFERYYEEEIALLQQDEDRVDSATNELYDWVIEDHLKDFKDNILTSIPQLRDSPLEQFSELYFNDFVTTIANDGGSRNTKMLSIILKLLIGADKVYQPIFLHAYWWKNATEVLAQLQLTQMFPIIIQNIEIRGNAIIKGSLEKYLVKEVIKLMLQRIYGNFDGATNSHLIDKWQYDVTKVLSLTNKITRAKNLSDIQLLHIINDLVAIKTIPFDDIKEIDQVSDKHEVFSEKFNTTILEKLDKLEQNEKNLIPKRSFIMRCLGFIPLESDIRLSLYKKLFSNEPFPLMGAIIERIFLKEDAEQEDVFLTLITNPTGVLRRSVRLNIINKCLNDLDTNMATLCCDVIEQTFFMNDELKNLEPFFRHALEALCVQGAPALQKITSIAFLKEFVRRFWDSFIQEDKNRPIAYDQMEDADFNSGELIHQINTYMNIAHPLVYSLKMYFLRDLRQRDFSIDDVRKFCEAQKRILPWLGTLSWGDIKENRLTFNPYYNLPEYNELEKGFMIFYGIGNKAPFQEFMQTIKKKTTLTAKLSLFGLFFVRLHAIRASREWQHPEVQSADFVTKELAGMNNFSVLFKTITTKILSNKQPLLQIINSITNTELILKSVITYIIALHSSVEPNSSQLAMYLHKLQDCQNLFILTCISDEESVVINAIASERIARYACKCGMIYVIGQCGQSSMTSRCPNCYNIIGGTNYLAAGNTRIDFEMITHVPVNDQAGYIGELVNQALTHSVRSLTPTSYRILHLIVHALIGASAPQSALAFLRNNNQIATDAEKYCMDHIRSDWAILKNILNCSDENLALMFYSLISSMTVKPPLLNQQIKSSADRENWETEFHRDYIAPQIRNINVTATNFRMKLNAALAKNQKNNVIEGEINQTLVMDKQYRLENLPALWRTIGLVNFESFRAYYMSDLAKNRTNYPFLSIFFKYAGQLELLKHLLPIVKFVQILNSKLGYQLTRQKAREMSFRQFIENQSNGGENREIFNGLKTAFDDFCRGWNRVLPVVKRYQCHELPREKPNMTYKLPVVFGLMEPKDIGILLCAILDFLVDLQNKFLEEVMSIPTGTCRSLKFLNEPTFNVEQTVSSTSKLQSARPNTTNGYYLKSMRIDLARSVNIINFDWDDEMLAHSQRNLAVARGQDIIYDLTKIEAELANILVFEKVYIETQPESQLYLEPFPYHMELFQECMRILSDIKNLITQEPIPTDKMNLLSVSGISSSFMFPQESQESTLDNASEILSSLEILLCFVKRTAVEDGEIPIKDYVSRWMKLSSLYAHEGFSKFLNIDLRLKHLVALYEFVEEQVADVKIKYINEKYKEELSADMKTAIMNSVDFKQQTTTAGRLIPADTFALALKRFMFRFLTLENQKEMEPLYVYLQDSSLNLWPSTIPENTIDELFPENLLVANTYDAYEFIMKGIEQTSSLTTNQRTRLATNSVNRDARRLRFDYM